MLINKTMKYYKSLEYLPVRRFYKTAETGNMAYLMTEIPIQEAEEMTLTQKQQEKLLSTWETLIMNYSQVATDKTGLAIVAATARLGSYHAEYNAMHAAALALSINPRDVFTLEYLKQKRVKNVDKELKILTNKINRLSKEVERLNGVNKNVEQRSLEDMVADAQFALGYPIDIDNMSILQWVALQKKAKELSTKNKDKK